MTPGAALFEISSCVPGPSPSRHASRAFPVTDKCGSKTDGGFPSVRGPMGALASFQGGCSLWVGGGSGASSMQISTNGS